MIRSRRLLAVLLAALALLWPAVPLSAAVHGTTLQASGPVAGGGPGCEGGLAHGSCPATPCAALPALLPAPPAVLAAKGGLAFVSVEQRGQGCVPGVPAPPPRASIHA
jgi:hypothetical protein